MHIIIYSMSTIRAAFAMFGFYKLNWTLSPSKQVQPCSELAVNKSSQCMTSGLMLDYRLQRWPTINQNYIPIFSHIHQLPGKYI